MGNHRYPKQCYLMLKILDDVGRKTWASSIQSLLYRFGFGYAWVAQEVGNEMNLLSLFKQRLIGCYTQKWYSDINNSSKSNHDR